MFLRQLDLTPALRPSLYDDETLLFVQDAVGLYEGKFKIANYQNGHVYLTSHRICYVDNAEPRTYSVAVNLKDVDHTEFYAGFLKSSAKITLFPKTPKNGLRSLVPKYASPGDALVRPGKSPPRSHAPSPAPAPAKDINATWICPICGFSNAVPGNFDPATANQHTKLPACQACGIPPPLVHMVKAAIAAISNRPAYSSPDARSSNGTNGRGSFDGTSVSTSDEIICPRCTFGNHASLSTCEICGASLTAMNNRRSQLIGNSIARPESPGPTLGGESIIGNDTIETIKFSFRAGGEKVMLERLNEAIVQRKWLLQSAPPIPKPGSVNNNSTATNSYSTSPPPQRVVGIAGLERRGAELRKNNQTVIGSAFEDLEALMTSAKEVIAMAEQFRSQSAGSDSITPEARALLTDSASALGLSTTRDMLGTGSSSETLYLTELARNLAEFLTDDRRGVLRREGGIISLVDLWAVFNRLRNGIELVSPLDFEKAANMWETLHLPIRLRQFKSGLLVVQDRSRTDQKTIAALLSWLRQPRPPQPSSDGFEQLSPAVPAGLGFGHGATAQDTAERFGWSVGVATEELDMAEDTGALCRDQCLDGTRFWENSFEDFVVALGLKVPSAASLEQMETDQIMKNLESMGF
ncbi:Vacuolar protein-sorting-associated protein 36 [Oleoguttula sp. CCFEE 5521]